jgi:hypothetical protein
MPLPPGFKVVAGTYRVDATGRVVRATCTCAGVPVESRLRTIAANPEKYSIWPPAKAAATTGTPT